MPSLALTRISLVCCVLSTSACADILGLGDFTFGDGGNTSTSTSGGNGSSDGGNGAGPSDGGNGGVPTTTGGMGGVGGEGGTPVPCEVSSYEDVVMCDAPLLYLRFEESDPSSPMANTANSTVDDGVYAASASFVDGVAGIGGNAVRLGNARCDVPDDGAIQFVPFGAFTVEAWIRADDSAENGTFGFVGTWDGDQGYSLFAFPGSTTGGDSPNAEFKRNVQPNIIQCTSVAACKSLLDFTQFRHVVATYDGAMEASLYINGLFVTSAMLGNALETSQTPFGLVGPAPSVASSQSVTFDEVAIYDRALTAQDVSRHYNCGNGGNCQGADQ